MEKTHRKEKPKILKCSRSHQHPVMAMGKYKNTELQNMEGCYSGQPTTQDRIKQHNNYNNSQLCIFSCMLIHLMRDMYSDPKNQILVFQTISNYN
jgi:hypothetical protein